MDFRTQGSAGRRLTSDWQQHWLDHYPCDRRAVLPYPDAPLTALVEEAARQFPARHACTLFDRALTYGQLQSRAWRLARSLRQMGAGPGRHVGILLPNIPEYLITMHAVWLTGATVLQLSPLMVAEEVDHWLAAADCPVVVTLDLLAPAVTASLGHGPLEHLVVTSLAERLATWRGWLYRLESLRRNGPRLILHDPHLHRFDMLTLGRPLDHAAEVRPDEDVAVLAPTGGTTASPKAVMLTHRNLLANAFQLRDWCGGPDGEVDVLGVLPFFHAYGLSASLLVTWAQAGTIHLHPRFEAHAVVELLKRVRPQLVPAVPAMLHALNIVLRHNPADLSFIRSVISGASALDPAERAEFEGHGVPSIIEGYGLSEASPVTHVNPQGEGNRPGSVGRPLSDTDARIVDPIAGREELPVGAVGELLIRGPQVMKGYFGNPLETARALRDGWLHTGDLARRDADGYFYIVDRKKDIIKTSGFLVYPAEVEEVLRRFPGVADAAVVGVPDADRGERVKAMVVPKEGVSLDVADLEAHCREHLGKQKRPREIAVVRELPKNFLGKVLRRKLREDSAVPAPGVN